ncbi:MAG: hypothetical protein LBQ61_07655, partial [Spirochaetales bacterium]|nr:hypothetical protein [Spirochaetales bacterium]
GLVLPDYQKDELYIRLGRFYENSPFRDERRAVEYYDLLVKECPSSLYWDEANRRSLYLKRHFFRIY